MASVLDPKDDNPMIGLVDAVHRRKRAPAGDPQTLEPTEEVNPPVQIRDLVPYAHVQDVGRSVEFYARLGFEPISTSGGPGEQGWWVYLQSDRARLMLASASQPVVADAQAVLFYLYTDDLLRLREQLVSSGCDPSPIDHPSHMPAGEMRLHDPDGYVLLVGQLRPKP